MKNATTNKTKRLFEYIDFRKVFISASDSILRRIIESVLVFILGGVAGAAIVAARLDPRVIAVEIKNVTQDGDIAKIGTTLDNLKTSDLQKQVQIQMLILYQIPTQERDALRKEAEKQIAVQQTLQDSTKEETTN